MDRIAVYLEVGSKRTFAGAIEWPGWCRSGKGEAEALEALLRSAGRYREALAGVTPKPPVPERDADLDIAERLTGNATTDFGAPGIPPRADDRPIDQKELARLTAILRSCWTAFAAASKEAEGVELRKGPRGGGRELDKIVEHVTSAEDAYLSKLLPKPPKGDGDGTVSPIERARARGLRALEARVHGEGSDDGTRRLWSPRYYVRRSAWHLLDHAWEIEDRSTPAETTAAAR